MTSRSLAERPTAQTKQLTPGARKAVWAATVGTLIEWYDYALYGAASGIIINKLFFPDLDESTASIAAFATFAVGFFVRPLGGIILANLGDRFGRKPIMIATILIMGGSTVAMGLIPTAFDIGIAALVILIILRMIQGFGAGAEMSGAITLLAEYTPQSRRGFFTAIPLAVGAAGLVLATLAFTAVSGLPDDILFGWAWRIPFLLSAVLFVLAIYIRRNLEETPEYVAAMDTSVEARKSKLPIKTLLRERPRATVFGFLSITGFNVQAYILNAFALSYLTTTVGLPRSEALIGVMLAAVAGTITTPLFGALADRIGARKVFLSGAVFAVLYSFPFFIALNSGSIVLISAALIVAYGVSFGLMGGGQGLFLANLFPTRYRFTGIAFVRELNGALVAGPTALVAAALVVAAGGTPWLVAIMISAAAVITIIGVVGVGSAAVADQGRDD